jgi:hypothetical protein
MVLKNQQTGFGYMTVVVKNYKNYKITKIDSLGEILVI